MTLIPFARASALVCLVLYGVQTPICKAEGSNFAKVKEIFSRHCTECHGNDGKPKGGLRILDFQALVKNESWVVKGKADDSDLYYQIDTDEMPPGKNPKLSPAEKKLVKDWITEGAPFEDQSKKRLDYEEVNERILRDLETLPRSERRKARYFSFTHLFNLGIEEQVKTKFYRDAMTKMLNSLSSNEKVFRPLPVEGTQETVYRVSLDQLSWSFDLWKEIEKRYPYFVHSKTALDIAAKTHSDVPIVRVDWFVKFASIEPLYSILADHPDDMSKLTKRLSIDLINNIRNGRALRAGFQFSGVSDHNRIIERHEIPHHPKGGGFWASYDFDSSSADADITTHPFGPTGTHPGEPEFKHAGGEFILHRPNGFQAYLISEANNKVIANGVAPIKIVKEPNGEVRNAISCFSCHALGLRDAKLDQVLPIAQSSGNFTKNQLIILEQLYASKPKLKEAYKKDNAIYEKALAEADIDSSFPPDLVGNSGKTEQISGMVDRFNQPVNLKEIAEELGVEPAILETRLNESPSLRALKAKFSGGGIRRRDYIELFKEIAFALNIELHKPSDEAVFTPGNEKLNIAGVSPEDEQKIFLANTLVSKGKITEARVIYDALLTKKVAQAGFSAGLELDQVDRALAFQYYLKAAELGEFMSQSIVSRRYAFGDNVKPDPAESERFGKMVAGHENLEDIQLNFAFNEYRRENFSKAEQILRRFEKNNKPLTLGLLSLTLMQLKEYPEAKRVAIEAANRGNREGMAVLGSILVSGHTGRPNIAEGKDWLIKAERMGNKDAAQILAELRKRGY